MRAAAAVDKKLIFPIDTELLQSQTLNIDNNQSLFKYLQYMSTNSKFSMMVL